MQASEKSFEAKQETWHVGGVHRFALEGEAYKLVVGVRSSERDLRLVQVFFDAHGEEERIVITPEKDKRDLSPHEQQEIIRVAKGYLKAHPEAGRAA